MTKLTSPTKPRVCLVANSSWNIYNFRKQVIEKFLSNGYSVTVLAPTDRYSDYSRHTSHVQHIDLKHLNRSGTNPVREFRLILELYGWYKKLNPDIVLHYTHKPNIYGGIAAKWARVKSIAIITGLGYAFLNKNWLQTLMVRLYRSVADFHNYFIFENIDDRLFFKTLDIVDDNNSASVKGCGVNLQHFKASQPYLPSKPEQTVFTFIGRLLVDKGIREYVAAAKMVAERFPQSTFYIIGESDLENPATVSQEEVQSWQAVPQVKVLGFQEDVRPFISQSDCIVLPSYREGMPRALTESLAMSRPVITTDVPGCREAVDDGINGYLVKPKDADDLAEKMVRFINLPTNEKAAMGKHGRLKAERSFSDLQIAQAIYDLTRG